ncbi:MAG: hypothetical protein ACRDPC_05245, partial [Solirubrobacteraceae bacterium]
MTSFEWRVVSVAPGGARAFDDAEWQDALVVVERGEIELEGLGGTRRRFARGHLLCLAGVPLRALHNRLPEPGDRLGARRRTGRGRRGRPRHARRRRG